jgi:acetyl-CoA acyltransferase
VKPVVALILGLTDPVTGLNMGQTAEVLAREFAIPRDAQDRFAKRSHDRVVAAKARGVYKEEIVPVYTRGAQTVVAEDIGPRPDTTVEKLAKLKPFFDRRQGTVTAGNSSMITDGAAAVLLMSAERAKALGIKPWVKVRAQAVVGCDPRRMGLGPAYAIPRVLAKAGLKLQDIDLIEINEAFAVQVLACLEALASRKFALAELGLADAVGEIADERLNVNGGAIALGHPVGASGARLVLTLAKEMVRRGAGLGLATLCIGGGQGQAVILERAN